MERLLTKAQVKNLVTYSFAHTARLEAAGLFPKRVTLGSGRVAYVEREVQAWIEAKIAARDANSGP